MAVEKATMGLDQARDPARNPRYDNVTEEAFPPNPKADGRWCAISVKVSRPGVVVRTRRGYYAMPPGAPVVLPHELSLAEALAASPMPRDVEHRAATLRFAGGERPSCSSGSRSRTRAARTGRRLDGLRQALDSLVPLRGHRSVILFSEGLVLLPKMQRYRGLIDAARRANVAIHFIDPRGLQSGFSAEFQDAPSTLFGTRRELDPAGSGDLADATGGHTFAGNDPVLELRQVGAESEAYYLRGYSPDAPRFGERKLRVKVKGEGLTVHARSRYYVSRPEEEAKTATRNRERKQRAGFGGEALLAMKAVPDATDVSLRASALFFGDREGRSRDLLAAEVPAVDGPHRLYKVVAEARRAEGGPPVQEQFESVVEGRPGQPACWCANGRSPRACGRCVSSCWTR